MIKSQVDKDGQVAFLDDQRLLDADELAAVRAAMVAGFSEFTTPVLPQGRVAWEVRKWVFAQDGKAKAFLVAAKTENTHLEILGPEIDLTPTISDKPVLQKRGTR